jgi:hypothetical protein
MGGGAAAAYIIQILDDPQHVLVLKPSRGFFVRLPGEKGGELIRKLGGRLVEVVQLSENMVEGHARTEADRPPRPLEEGALCTIEDGGCVKRGSHALRVRIQEFIGTSTGGPRGEGLVKKAWTCSEGEILRIENENCPWPNGRRCQWEGSIVLDHGSIGYPGIQPYMRGVGKCADDT